MDVNTNGEKFDAGNYEEKLYGYINLLNTWGDQKPVQMYLITEKQFKVGRDYSCAIRIPNLKISRQQCLLTVPEAGENKTSIYLKNITSKPTTIYRNVSLNENQEVLVKDGETFTVFDEELQWRAYNPSNKSGQLDKNENILVRRLSVCSKDISPTQERKSEKINNARSSSPRPSKSSENGKSNSSLTLINNSERLLCVKRRLVFDVDERKCVRKRSMKSPRKSVRHQITSFAGSEPSESFINKEVDNATSDSSSTHEHGPSSQNNGTTSEERKQGELTVVSPSNNSVIGGDGISTVVSNTGSLLPFPSPENSKANVLPKAVKRKSTTDEKTSVVAKTSPKGAKLSDMYMKIADLKVSLRKTVQRHMLAFPESYESPEHSENFIEFLEGVLDAFDEEKTDNVSC